MVATAPSRGVFRYANPGVIRWGAGAVAGLGEELERLGASRPAIVSTRSVAGDEALTGPVRAALPAGAEAALVVIGQHAPVGEIESAVERLAALGPDVLVSLGGGSPIDAAKVVAAELGRRSGARVAHVAVPTTLSVAELAEGAGVTDEQGNKVGRRAEGMLPDAVVYDGALALRTPLPLWLSTGIRALDHAVEGYLLPGEHGWSDLLAVEAVRRLFDSLPRALAAPGDPGVRTENQLAAWFGYTQPGAAAGLSHMLGKQVGARHGIPHGVTSCLLLAPTLRYRARAEGERIASLARASGLGDDAEGLASAIEALVAELDLPRHLGAFGLDEADLRRAAEGLAGAGHDAGDLVEVYRAAW